MPRAASRHPGHAFSLIELLVVMSIIGLLIAILLPALARSREAARSAACLSNQRQTVLALLNYTGDNDARFVPNRMHLPDNHLMSGRCIWWFGEEVGGLHSSFTQNRPLDKTASPLAPYFGGDILTGLACAAFPADSERFFPKFNTRSAHFGYNTTLAPHWYLQQPPLRVEQIRRSTQVVAFADAIHLDGFHRTENGQIKFYEPHYLEHSQNPSWPGGLAHFRHNQAANLVFVDGHGSSLPVTEAASTMYDQIAGSPAGNLSDNWDEHSPYGQ